MSALHMIFYHFVLLAYFLFDQGHLFAGILLLEGKGCLFSLISVSPAIG